MNKHQRLMIEDKERRRKEQCQENIAKARQAGNFKLAETLIALDALIESRKAKL